MKHASIFFAASQTISWFGVQNKDSRHVCVISATFFFCSFSIFAQYICGRYRDVFFFFTNQFSLSISCFIFFAVPAF